MPLSYRRAGPILGPVLALAATLAVAGPLGALHIPDHASEQQTETIPPNSTATTDDEGDGATPSDVVETSVYHLSGGSVTIREGPPTGAAPAGHELLGEQVDISVPDNPNYDGIGADDNVYTFRLDGTVFAGRDPVDVVVFHHGNQVNPCPLAVGPMDGTFIENPCRWGQAIVADDLEYEVLHRSPGPSTPSFTFAAPIVEGTSATLTPGGSLTTDHEGDGATGADPIETTLTHPIGGAATILERPSDGSRTFLGQTVEISALPATVATPIVIVFLLDSTLLGGRDPASIEVFKDAVGPIAACDAGSSASPDPCVASRRLASDDLELTVRTSTASIWRFGAPTAPAPTEPPVSTAPTASPAPAAPIGPALIPNTAVGR